MLFEGVESRYNHMESIGSRKYPYSLLGDSLEIPRGRPREGGAGWGEVSMTNIFNVQFV